MTIFFIMDYSVLLFVCMNFFRLCYNFSLNSPGYSNRDDPVVGRSPGPLTSYKDSIDEDETLIDENSGSRCHLSGPTKQLDTMAINLTISHKMFKTNVLVPGITYQVTIAKRDTTTSTSASDVLLTTSQDGVFTKLPSNNIDDFECGPHVYKGRLESQTISLNWSLHTSEEHSAPNITFRLEYSSGEAPFVYMLRYSFPLSQGCQLHLIPDQSTITNTDLPKTSSDCQVYFPAQQAGHGIVMEIVKLNVPCSKGSIRFSGLNETHNTRQKDSYVYVKSHKQTHLCGKLEELSEEERHIYFPSSHPQPAMHLHGGPIFAITYRLVDHCYNVTFVARNGSFELKPKGQLQCTYKIFLPYGNRVVMKMWMGDTTVAGSPETGLNFQDFRNGENVCEGLLTQLQDGSSTWSHCTKIGHRERQIDIVSRENKVTLKVTVRTGQSASASNFLLRVSYLAEPIEGVAGGCEFGWIRLRQFCVAAMEGGKLPWARAEGECARRGGHLVSLRSERDQAVLDRLLMNSPGYRDDSAYWIGASDQSHEGDFRWSDGLPFSYTNWFPGWPSAHGGHYNRQPNDDGLSEQDCVEARRTFAVPSASRRLADAFMWNDRDCATANYFVCERLRSDDPLNDSWIPNCNRTVFLSRDQPKSLVSSPGFPRQYPDNANCDIEITATPGFRIILDFEELVLENEPSCSYDYLLIVESFNESTWNNDTSTATRRLCGDWSAKLKLLRYVSRTSRLKLRFSSDYSHHFGGFKARVSMENAVQCADDRFFMFNNSCYLIVSYPEVTWNTSQQICEGLKSNLSSVLTPEEEKFITTSIRRAPEYRTSARYWLGAMFRGSYKLRWIDGQRMDYVGWIPGQAPTENDLASHADQKTCLSIQWTPSHLPLMPSGFYWRSHRCDDKGGYICKRLHQVRGSDIDVNRTLNGTEGTLTTPNYPHPYHNNLDFSVNIHGPEKSRLVVKFVAIDVESQIQCLYDYVELQSVYKNRNRVINDATKLCGSHDRNMEEFNFVSETNEVRINFHSDYSIAGKGFSLVWYAADVSACPKQTLTAQEGTISSPNYPHFLLAHLDCVITIMAPSNKRIWLEFFHNGKDFSEIMQTEDFNLELSLGEFEPFFKPFGMEGILSEGSFISPDEVFRLRLRTGDNPLGQGFRASYKIIKAMRKEKIVTLGNSTSGSIFHLNFPHSPPSRVDFLQHLIAPLGSTISLELHNMKFSDTGCSDQKSYIEIVDNYSDINGTVWKLCYKNDSREDSLPASPIYILSYLNTLHLRQSHGASGVPLNCSLKVRVDENYKTKLLMHKEREVESCSPNPCQNGGKCIVKKMERFCQCAGYYTGLFCALTKCDLEPCIFGDCELTESSYRCHCQLGYTGLACDQKRRPCESNPCEGRGKCLDRGDSFQCQCHAWWEGQRCERRMTHIPYTPLSERMLHEPFWLGLMTVFVVMGVIGLVWCAKRHFPEKIEKLLAEEDSRNRSNVSSLRSSSVREQLAASAAAANYAAAASSPAGSGAGGPAGARSIFGRLGIRKPSILSLTSPRAYEPPAARTFSLDDLLKPPPRRTPSPKKKRNNSTPVKKNVAEKREILQQLVSPKPNSKKVSLRELIKLSELSANVEGKGKDDETKFSDSDVQSALTDPKLEKKVTFARLLNKVSAEMSSGSEMELGIMQTNRLGCMFARAASTPPSPSVGLRSPNSTSSNQDLLINRRHNRLSNGRLKPSSADSILAMFRNFSSSSAAANLSSSLKVSPSTTPTASSPQDDVAGDDDSSTSSIHTPISFSGFQPESPLSQRRSTIEVPVLDQMNAHKSSSVGSNLLHPPTILLEIPSTINKCLSPIREMPTPIPSPCLTPVMRRSNASSPMLRRSRHSTASSSLDDAEISDDRISVEIPNISLSSDMDDDDVRCADIAIDLQAEDGLILEEAAAMQHSLIFRPKVRPPPIGQKSENTAITITVEPPPLIIPTLIIQTPSPTHPRIPSLTFPGSPPPHCQPEPKDSCFQFPSPKQARKMLKDFDKPTSLDLPYAPPMITITCNLSEVESDAESISPHAAKSAGLMTTSSGMTYLSPLSMNVRGEHTASESNLSSSGYSSMTSPGPSRCGSSNPLCPSEMDDPGSRGSHRRQSLTPVTKSTSSTTSPGCGHSDKGLQEQRRRSDSEVESNDEGIGTDHIDEKIDDGELKSAKELEVFMVNESESCKTLLDSPIGALLAAPKTVEDSIERLIEPLIPSHKNLLQLPSIVVQDELSGCKKQFSPANSRSESPLSDRTSSMGRLHSQFYDKQRDMLPFTDSDGLYDFPSNERITTGTYHKKPAGRRREKKLLRNCKTPSPTKPPPPIFFSHLDIPSKESMTKIPPLRKLSPKRRSNRIQMVSSSSSSDSVCSTTKEIKHSSSSPSPDTLRWSSPVAWIGEKCSRSAEHSCHDIQNIDSSSMVKSADFGKTRYGGHQKVSRLRAISHQIRFLRRLEHSLKKKDHLVSPSGSFDSDEDSPEVTSPLLTKETKAEIRKSNSIGKLQSTSKSTRGRYSKGELLLPQDNSLKVVFTGNGYSD